MSFMDKVLNAATGRDMETISVSLEQFVSLLNREFISKAQSKAEFDEIYKTVKGSMFLQKRLTSKDGVYEIYCDTGRKSTLNPKERNLIWIHDKTNDRYYQYTAFSFRELKKAVQAAIVDAKLNS